jgi:hypothetical protein
VAAEREAGYILLGSMCAAAAPGLLAGRDKQAQVLELFSVALGPGAAEALATAGAPGALCLWDQVRCVAQSWATELGPELGHTASQAMGVCGMLPGCCRIALAPAHPRLSPVPATLLGTS